jgi:hypothetical protein
VKPVKPSQQQARECLNTWDQLVEAGGDQIAISYHPRDSRGVQAAKYSVWRIKDGQALKTDPHAAWYDHHLKTFMCWSTDRSGKSKALAQAMAWADATYGKRDWVRNRQGDYLARETNTKFPLRKQERRKQ